MRRLIAIAVVLCAATIVCSAADLDEARGIVDTEPEKALLLAREVLATDPHSIEAHVIAINALRLMRREGEAIAPLEAWSIEAPDAFPPLWMLFDLHAGMKEWASVARLATRAPSQPEAERRRFLQSIVLAQLDGERYSEAIVTLRMLPVPVAGELGADLFAALAATANGSWSESYRALAAYLTSEANEIAQTKALWWTAEVARTLSLSPYPRGTSKVDGILAESGNPIDDPKGVELPVLKRRVQPEYPAAARANRIGGKVTTFVVVLATGHVAFPTVAKSSSVRFDRISRKAAIGWRYDPARLNGRAVPVYYTIAFKFEPP